MMSGSNIQYEMADRSQAVGCGGIGAIHLMARRIGLVGQLNDQVQVLKRHLPCHESDHVLTVAYDIIAGGVRIGDLELRRTDEAFMNGLGAQRLPDPTTAGDFTRRFQQSDTVALMEAINAARQRVWQEQPENFLEEAVIDVDGTIAGTLGQCKQGMSMSYKGIWGYAPLITSLANTREVLYLVNRPGNAASHQGAAEWIDRSIDLVRPHAKTVFVRGDTDFALTKNFDRWTDAGVRFLFGMDAQAALVARAQALHEAHWRGLARVGREIKTGPRARPENVKEQIVREKGYLNKVLQSEQVAEFEYQPGACERTYRVVALRKNISVERGEDFLFADLKYFFYITNRTDLAIEEVVRQANQRCDQENVIEQLKNGVNAMRMPVDNLLSNRACMVMAALAWNLKAWFGLLMPDAERGRQIMRMEFRSFLAAIIQVPAQIVRTARRILYRVMGYNGWLKDFFATWERLRRMEAS